LNSRRRVNSIVGRLIKCQALANLEKGVTHEAHCHNVNPLLFANRRRYADEK
jgi:hypothetical protein